MNTWITLGKVSPQELTIPRLELHHAVQLISIGVGRMLVPSRHDDSHTTLAWRSDTARFVGEEIPGTHGVRAGFDPARFTLTLGSDLSLDLVGHGPSEALEWLAEQITKLGGKGADVKLDIHYEMPSHPTERGAPFTGEPLEGCHELARWFSNASGLLEELGRADEDASPVRTWPHHFDVGYLVPVGPMEDRYSTTIGIGLSPGDEGYAEPYFYVNVWPAPEGESPKLPPLPFGSWHAEGFFGAILTGSELLEGGIEGQEERAREFLAAAICGARELQAA